MGAAKFQIIDKFRGYENRRDITNIEPGTLVVGSHDVLFNLGERIASRTGYTLYGQANTALTPIESSYDWFTHLGEERHLRSYDDELEYLYVASDGTVTWRRLANGLTSVAFNYAEFWNTTESSDELLMVNGSSNIYAWSGGITTFASATAATITKQGVETWGELGFYTSGTRTVVIDGITYTYTGGEGTTTLTGVTPNPTLGAHAVGAVINQGLRTTPNSAMTAIPATFDNCIIGVLYNQIYIGSFFSRQIYVSKVNSYTDYSFSVPRAVGEGALFTLDGIAVGFVPQESSMYMTAGKDHWYQTQFQLSADNADESLTIQKLKTNPQGAAQSQALISKIKNDVTFVSNEPTMDTLGRIQNVLATPQSVNISYIIKLDFDSYDFTGGQVFYFRDQIFVAIPANNVVRIYNLVREFWEAPQTLGISRFAIIEGELYGHSSVVPETYKLYTGYNDNGQPINPVATFSYEQRGDRANQKNESEYYTEGYITSNTILTQTIRYDYQGSSGTLNLEIDGSDQSIIFDNTGDGSLGKQSLGKKSLAGRGATQDESLPPKFRVIKTFTQDDYYESQVEYSSNQVDGRWELLARGPAASMSTSENMDIKQ